MGNVYFIASIVSGVLIGITLILSGLSLINQSQTIFHANERSVDSLYDDLCKELNKAKKRFLINKIIYYSLSTISIIGGIMVSTVYFNKTFSEQIGVFGLFILLSSVIILIFRPQEKYQQANRDKIVLKSIERDYLCIENTQEKNTFLREKLNEYDKRPIAD